LLVYHRTLVLVSGLTVGDYLLWNWSLNANHEVTALVSGLTLPPLVLLALWRIAVAVARALAWAASRQAVKTQSLGATRPADVNERPVPPAAQPRRPAADARSDSRKLAA
jgi:hypothetical protein